MKLPHPVIKLGCLECKKSRSTITLMRDEISLLDESKGRNLFVRFSLRNRMYIKNAKLAEHVGHHVWYIITRIRDEEAVMYNGILSVEHMPAVKLPMERHGNGTWKKTAYIDPTDIFSITSPVYATIG